MIDAKVIQHFLNIAGGYGLVEDGQFGPKSYTAGRDYLADRRYPATWDDERTYIALEQLFLNATINAGLLVDGVSGPKTLAAIAAYEATTIKPVPTVWPRQRDVPAYFGAITMDNQVYVDVPYTMYEDYQRLPSQLVTRICCHRKVAAALGRILARTKAYYGADKIRRYNLDIFSGSRVVRIITGGVGYSMHSWGIAFDFDAAHNQFNQQSWEGADFAEPRFQQWIDFWYDEGAISLGRERNYDWMHFQMARL
ncbi:MAG: hypothetical protein M3R04_07300 [bacterium]|nr:hypothetical protein [bacterium]